MNKIRHYNHSKVNNTSYRKDSVTWQVGSMNYSEHFTQAYSPLSDEQPDFTGARERTWYLLNRAYQNIYGMNMPSEPQYQQTLFNAALHLMLDKRARGLSEKQLLTTFEDIIRISDEHHREATKHLSRAGNPVYLRETALDKAMEHQKYMQALEEITPASKIRSVRTEHTGRVERPGAMKHVEVVELTCQQLALTLEEKKA